VILSPVTLRADRAGGRLLDALERRGHAVGRSARPPDGEHTVFLCPAPEEPAPALQDWLSGSGYAGLRLLVITRLGTHRDAAGPRLRECWELEETARRSGLPALVLRLGPMLGPESPLWLRLRADPSLPRRGAKLLNPVAESAVLETLELALAEEAPWAGWYEVAGPEVWTLGELAALAREAGPVLPAGAGAWEPPLAELEEHRLAEPGPWLGRFPVAVRPLADQARAWAAAPTGRVA